MDLSALRLCKTLKHGGEAGTWGWPFRGTRRRPSRSFPERSGRTSTTSVLCNCQKRTAAPRIRSASQTRSPKSKHGRDTGDRRPGKDRGSYQQWRANMSREESTDRAPQTHWLQNPAQTSNILEAKVTGPTTRSPRYARPRTLLRPPGTNRSNSCD